MHLSRDLAYGCEDQDCIAALLRVDQNANHSSLFKLKSARFCNVNGKIPADRRNPSNYHAFLHGKEFAHEDRHARPLVYRCHDGLLPDQPRLRSGVRKTMTPWELVMGLVMAVGLTAYLVYAMLRPEKF
jgi:K+-transporting ATPase KdpF subunit